jgi:DNA-binding beta-propeller fold protein YncE
MIQRLRQASAADPSNGALIYALARTLEQVGQAEQALESLQRLPQIGWDYALDDSDFPKTRQLAGYKEVAARLLAAEPKVRRARLERTLRERDLLPEGTAFDPETGALFLSSVHKRKVVRVDRDGAVSDFLPEAKDGLLATLGMRVDPKRRHLWVVSSTETSMKGFQPDDMGRSALHVFDLASGRLVHRWTLGSPADSAYLNDVAVLADGRGLITDSRRGTVYVAEPGKPDLALLFPPRTFAGPNGLDVHPDQKRFYVATFFGVFTVDLATKNRAPLAMPPKAGNFAGIDGLYIHNGTLIGIQNAIGRPRIWRLRLNPAGDAATHVEILESGGPDLDLATTGAIVGDGFVFVANPQIRGVGEDGKVLPPERLQDLKLYRLPLG